MGVTFRSSARNGRIRSSDKRARSLTPQARATLAFIDHYRAEREFSPTIREIAAFRVMNLEGRMLVEMRPGLARSLRLTEAGRAAIGLSPVAPRPLPASDYPFPEEDRLP